MFWLLDVTCNKISILLRMSVLLAVETREDHRPTGSNRYNVSISCISQVHLGLCGNRTYNVSGNRH